MRRVNTIMKFNIVIEKDDEGRYVAECLDLPGCLSEGETLEDALENINEAIIGCMKSRLKSAGEKLKITSFNRRLDISVDLQRIPFYLHLSSNFRE